MSNTYLAASGRVALRVAPAQMDPDDAGRCRRRGELQYSPDDHDDQRSSHAPVMARLVHVALHFESCLSPSHVTRQQITAM
jgi:hypothetical protein